MTTVPQAIASFLLACHADGLSPRTVEAYRTRLLPLQRRHPDTPIADITADNLRAIIADLYADRSPHTVHGHVRALKRFFHRFAIHYLLAGGDLASLADLLGHRDVEVTRAYYARFALDDLQRKHDEFSPARGLTFTTSCDRMWQGCTPFSTSPASGAGGPRSSRGVGTWEEGENEGAIPYNRRGIPPLSSQPGGYPRNGR